MMDLFELDSDSVIAPSHSEADFMQRLDSVRLDVRQFVLVAVVYSPNQLDSVLRDFAARPQRSIRLIIGDTGEVYPVTYYSLVRQFGRKRKQEVSGSFVTVKTHRPDVWLVVAVNTSSFWRFALAKLVDALYPYAVRPFFTQPELQEFVHGIQRQVPQDGVRIMRISTRERLRSAKSRKRYESSLRWTDADPDTTFREAAAENVWFRSVAIEIRTETPNRLNGVQATISKQGFFSSTGGTGLFHSTVLIPMVDLAHERLRFLSKRDRRATPASEPRPLKIRYGTDVFANREQILRFVEVMRRFKHGTCSVLHGNPYVHVSLVDNIDFSSADVWVLNRDDVLIVPQVRTSEAALRRIVSHIFENFREGKLGEYKEEAVRPSASS